MTATKTPTMDIWSIKPIPGFDVIKMKEELQERRRRETQGMTPEEVNEYICKGAEKFDRYCEEFRARQGAQRISESQTGLVAGDLDNITNCGSSATVQGLIGK